MKHNKRYLKKHHLNPYELYGFDVYINNLQMDDECYNDIWDEIIDIVEQNNCYCYGHTIATEQNLHKSLLVYAEMCQKFEKLSDKYSVDIQTSKVYDVHYFYSEMINNEIKYIFAREYLPQYQIDIFEKHHNCKGENYLNDDKRDVMF